MKARDLLNLFESSSTVTLFHGGKDLKQSFQSSEVNHSKGRWEYGPGLYLTTEYSIAAKYAKGNRKLYSVTVEKGTDISKVTLSLEEVKEFLSQYAVGAKRKEVLSYLQKTADRMSTFPNVGAEYFLNVVINCDAVKSTNTGRLRSFLVDKGVDYCIESYEGYPLLVVFNSSKISKVVEVDRSKLKVFSMPFDWKR